jgi:hypothetical protein
MMGLVHRRAFVAASAATVVMPISLMLKRRPPATWLGDDEPCRTRRRLQQFAGRQRQRADCQSLSAASTTLRSQRPKQLDVPYGPGERNKWDLFLGR